MKTQLKKELEKLNDFSKQQVIKAKIVLSTYQQENMNDSEKVKKKS
jgi:hypothetical protein